MKKWEEFGLTEFLSANPKLQLVEMSPERLAIEGWIEINHQLDGYNPISETVRVKLIFPKPYPKELPEVVDLGKRFPATADYHMYGNHTCCLGSDIRLLALLSRDPSFQEFFDDCVIPFFYSVFHKIKYKEFPYGDLAHGEAGLIDDYEQLFGVDGKSNVLLLLKALGMRERQANKLLCPCGCGKLLGKCDFRHRLSLWRKKAKREWYRNHLLSSFSHSRALAKRGSQ